MMRTEDKIAVIALWLPNNASRVITHMRRIDLFFFNRDHTRDASNHNPKPCEV
jgi:hypothetical protein